MAEKRWGWVRILKPQEPGRAIFEVCAPLADGPPGEGWIEADDALVDLLHDMQSRVFKAENVLEVAKDRVHIACNEIAKAQSFLREARR